MPVLENMPVEVEIPVKDRPVYEQVLKAGKHTQKDFDGVDRTYSPGEIVLSNVNLAQRWPEKFDQPHRAYYGGQNATPNAGQQSVSIPPTPLVPPLGEEARKAQIRATYEAMNHADLKKLAEEEEVTFPKYANKEQMIQAFMSRG